MLRSAGRTPFGRSGLVPILLVALLVAWAAVPLGTGPVRGEASPDHLVISEIVTGGASASDEFIELYNPTAEPLPLEGLELVYVSASGLTVSRRAAWEAGSPDLPPAHHLLVAHELGAYAGIADAAYASGVAATGGSVALRIQGAASAIDSVGWGTATSAWLEGRPAAAPGPGASIERLPGGTLGSTQDTDDNAADFMERLVPDPQNRGSAPTPDPSAPSSSPAPTATPTPAPTSTAPPTPIPTPSPTPDAGVPVATARALPDGTRVTIQATALTGSSFTDGGGYVADASGGIAVLLSSGSFERGALLRITGTVDDRFSQRTLRVTGADVTPLGTGSEPAPLVIPTGSVDEQVESRLVRVSGTIAGAPTTLSAGLAFDLDDGSGATRLVVGSTTGIDTAAWTSGAAVDVVGVTGQRDSTGSGTSGYRVMPRDGVDVQAAGTPAPSATASATPDPDGIVTIADARALPKNSRVGIQGTITMGGGIVDPVSAVIQDATGAILLRLGDEVGPVARGDRLEIHGVRSTLSGMETIRVTSPATRLGTGAEPAPIVVRTGDAGESLEAQLVRVRGALVATARRVSSGTVSFEIDDGSGPLRVYLAAPLAAETAGFVSGAWIQATGVLGQDTTGAQPTRGYRVWPRSSDEVIVAAAPPEDGPVGGSQPAVAAGSVSGGAGTAEPDASLADIGAAGLADLRVGATLVHGPWPELGVAGVLWDGERLVLIAERSTAGIRALLSEAGAPIPVELTGLVAVGREPQTGTPIVALGDAPGDTLPRSGPVHPPTSELPTTGGRWVSLIGRLSGSGDELHLRLPGTSLAVGIRCDERAPHPAGSVGVTGIALAHPARLLVPCQGIRPAPSFRAAAARLGPGEAAEPPVLAETPGPLPVPGGRQGLAAALLALGALLVVGAAATRRSGVLGTPAPPGDDGSPAPTAAELPVEPPALALVPVPHEARSP